MSRTRREREEPTTINPTPTSADTIRDALRDDDAIRAVRQRAFRALLDGCAPTATELASTAELPVDQIERAIAALRELGALEVEPTGRVVGAHGLTQRTTRHTVTAAVGTLHTWCALDAIGIPVALDLDAEVQTSCPACAATLSVDVHYRSATGDDALVLWQPTGPCAHVMDDFCASANLFCSIEHLEQWRARAGEPQGRPLTLAEVAEHGREVWRDVGQ